MGWCPRQVNETALWEFMAALDGYGRANGWKEARGGGGDLSEDELREMGIVGFTDDVVSDG